MRLAVFGGTFDPPHRGHLAIARAAAELKRTSTRTDFADRLAMTRLAVAELSTEGTGTTRFEVSPLDAPRADGEPNFTVDLLERVRHLEPEAELFSIVGADAILELPQWRRPERLLELAEWIAVSRPGAELGERELREAGLTDAGSRRVHLLGGVAEPVSSTELRRLLRAGESCEGLLGPAVRRYIAEHGLYRPAATQELRPSL